MIGHAAHGLMLHEDADSNVRGIMHKLKASALLSAKSITEASECNKHSTMRTC